MEFLLKILTVVPALVNAAERLFAGFPGRGQVKKDVVMQGVDAMISAASSLGATTYGWSTTIGAFIDSYVGIQNALGDFQHEPRRQGPER